MIGSKDGAAGEFLLNLRFKNKGRNQKKTPNSDVFYDVLEVKPIVKTMFLYVFDVFE